MKKDFIDFSSKERIAVFLILYLGLPIFFGTFLSPLYMSDASEVIKSFAINTACLSGVIAYLIIYKDSLNIFNFSQLNFKNFLVLVLFSCCIFFIVIEIAKMLNARILLESFEGQSVILIFLNTVIIKPILEELVMRFVAFNLFGRKWLVLGYLFSSFLFAIHYSVTDLGDFVLYFLLGLFIGGVYYKTRSIELAILAHVINNLLLFLFI